MTTFLVYCCAIIFFIYGWSYTDAGLHLLLRDAFHVKAIFTTIVGILLIVSSFGLLYLRSYMIVRAPAVFDQNLDARVEVLERKVEEVCRILEHTKPEGDAK